jgi:galactose mutarotase-like enzyme
MPTSPTPLETVLLEDPAARSRVWLAPKRGALVTRFSVGGREVLFLDEATLLDETKNVRGGVPVLFPSPGKLQQDRWARGGLSGTLGQHGFARNLPWEVVEQSASAAALRLTPTPATRANYPFEFQLDYRFSLTGAALRIEQRIHNPGPLPLPFGCGFHPYFHIPQAQKAGARIETGATRAFDNVTKQEVALTGAIDLSAKEVDLHLEDHGRADCTLALADGARIVVSGSPELSRWVIWTLAGKEFVCLEPWTGPGDGLNTGSGLLVAAPGETRSLWTELALEGG